MIIHANFLLRDAITSRGNLPWDTATFPLLMRFRFSGWQPNCRPFECVGRGGISFSSGSGVTKRKSSTNVVKSMVADRPVKHPLKKQSDAG
jgi:hypothetical protein